MSTLAVTLTGIAPATLTIELGTPGPRGLQGIQGIQGDHGIGVPSGGIAGMVLAKIDEADFNTEWIVPGAGFLPLSGGSMDINASINFEDSATVSNLGAFGFAVSLIDDGNQFANVLFDRVLVRTESSQTSLIPTGIEFPDSTIQTTAALPFDGGAITGPITMVGATTDTEMSGELFGVQLSADHTKGTTVEFDGINTYDGASQMQVNPTGLIFPDASVQTTAYTGGGGGDFLPLAGGTMTGAIVFDGTSGQYINKGNFDSGRGGNFGISLVCSVGYEFNWQAGWLITTQQSSTTPRPLYLDSLAGTTLRSWDSATDTGVEVSHTGITFPDASVQSVAFPGFTGYATETFVTSQGFITDAALAPYLTSADAATTYQTISGMSSYLTTSSAASTYQTLSGMSSYLTTSSAASTYQTLAGMSSYLTTSAAASTYAVIARGLPASGTAGQVLTKVNGTDYNATWSTIIPGDRYLTTSTTSNTVSNGAKTFTVGTGLSYTTQQDVTIANDASHHMHALVTSYNSGTGVLVVDVQQHTGTGTFTAWTVNVGGTVPLASVIWGDITGTLGNQTDLANALNAKLELSGGTMTGGLSIVVPSGGPSYGNAGFSYGGLAGSSYDYGVTSSWSLAGSTGLAWNNGTVSGAFNSSGITFPDTTVQATAGISQDTANASFYPIGNPSAFIGDAPYDSQYNARYNGTWQAFQPGFAADAPGDGNYYARQNSAWQMVTPKSFYSDAVWYNNQWYSATVRSLTDGYGNYYNALTF